MTPEERRQRDAEIKRLRRLGMTLEEIGGRFGITRERVRQLCRDIPVPDHKPMMQAINCKACGGLFFRPAYQHADYCSKQCSGRDRRGGAWSQFTVRTYTCAGCGCEFERSNSLDMTYIRNGAVNRYCSHQCYLANRRVKAKAGSVSTK